MVSSRPPIPATSVPHYPTPRRPARLGFRRGVGAVLALGVLVAGPGLAPSQSTQAAAAQIPAQVALPNLNGSTLSPAAAERIARITEPFSAPTLPGPHASLSDLEAATQVSREVTRELQRAGDLRGVFGAGLDAIESEAVVPFERHATPWAPAISTNLIYPYLHAIHADFTGGPVPPQWKRYFDAARSGHLSADRVAMLGYNAHLSVDLAEAVAAAGSTEQNYPEFLAIVGTIADHADQLLDATRQSFGVEIVPIWSAVAVNPGLRTARDQVVLLGDQAYSSISFAHGLAIARSAVSPVAGQRAVAPTATPQPAMGSVTHPMGWGVDGRASARGLWSAVDAAIERA